MEGSDQRFDSSNPRVCPLVQLKGGIASDMGIRALQFLNQLAHAIILPKTSECVEAQQKTDSILSSDWPGLREFQRTHTISCKGS
jgi:hypothetical protein